MTDADLAVDAATGQVVAGWHSGAGTTDVDWLQGVAPTVGPARAVPGRGHTTQEVAGRD